jgi:MerR family transcriptional regulator, copper efflux regulator
MGLVGIGEAARSLGLNPSALRYYDERGLLRPTTRQAGRRMYDTAQLRRLVLIQMMQRLGIPLDAAAAIMDEPGDDWRDGLADQIGQLDDLIARATLARDFLTHAARCPADHPLDQCPTLIAALDRRLSGVSFEQLVQEHGTDDGVPPRAP